VGFLLGIYLFMVSSLLCYRRVWADPKLGRDLEFELALVKAKFKHSLRFVRELDNHLIAWTQHSFGGVGGKLL